MKVNENGFSIVELLLVALPLCVIAAVVCVIAGCPKDERGAAIDRVADAARALNGDPDETPDIVRRAQNAEKKRQNIEWTAENQAKYPVEYCQAQLGELETMSSRLDVEIHRLNVIRAGQERRRRELEETVSRMGKQLSAAKEAYRESDAAETWSMEFNGHALSREQAQRFIVETKQRLETAQSQIVPVGNLLGRVENRLRDVQREQVDIVRTKEQVSATLSGLMAKQIVEGEKGIGEALAAINDSIGSLSGWTEEPSFEDLSVPTPETALAESFAEIMAE